MIAVRTKYYTRGRETKQNFNIGTITDEQAYSCTNASNCGRGELPVAFLPGEYGIETLNYVGNSGVATMHMQDAETPLSVTLTSIISSRPTTEPELMHDLEKMTGM